MSTTADPPVRPTPAASDPVPPRPRGTWHGLVLRLHFYAGLFAGPFLLVATVTGLLYVLTPQLESWLYRDQLTAPVTATTLPLTEQVRSAGTVHPDLELAAVRPAPEPGATTRVLFTDPALGESEHRTVFVDPGTGAVRGDLVTYGTNGALPLRTTLDELHRNLLLGDPGRMYSELAASWLSVVALGGLALWTRRWWRRGPDRRVLNLVRPPRTGPRDAPGSRARTRDRHGALGVWLLLGALFLSATGMTWSTFAGANVSTLREALGWTTPTVDTGTGAAGEHAGHMPGMVMAAPAPASPEQTDAVLATARGAGIDASQVEITLPDTAGEAWQVDEIRRAWPTQVDSAAVTPDGRVIDVVRFDTDYGLIATLARWGIDAHTGVLFGWVNQLVLVAFAVGMIALIVLGYRMWWTRRPRHDGRAWSLPRRGSLRRLGPAGAVVVLVAAGVGWFAPLFGVSLLAFVVVDVIVGRRRRRAAAGEPS